MKYIIFMAFMLATNANADVLSLKLNGNLVASIDSVSWKKGTYSKEHSDQKEEEVELYNVFRKERRTYVGYDFRKILNEVYGKKWESSKIVVFKAKDGFTKGTKTEVILDTIKKHKGLLAYKEKGKSGFTTFEKRDKEINPGDFWLVWGGFKEGFVNLESQKDLQWPYQLKEIDVKF